MRLYPVDVFPKMWEVMDALSRAGVVVAVDEVRVELEKKDDRLLKWLRTDGRHQLFQAIDEPVQVTVAEILAHHRRLLDTRKNCSAADPFVIALAKVHGLAVVTMEAPTGNPDRPNLPDVCNAYRLPWMRPLEMFRAEGASF